MRRLIGSGAAMVVELILLVSAGTAMATPGSSPKTGSSTTLDACGYFVGTQTPSNDAISTSKGVSYDIQHGTWTGVENNYVFTPVASLGVVQGAFTQVTQTAADGTVTGTERFTSNAGKIDQTFTYGLSVIASHFETLAVRVIASARGCRTNQNGCTNLTRGQFR